MGEIKNATVDPGWVQVPHVQQREECEAASTGEYREQVDDQAKKWVYESENGQRGL